MIEGQDKNVHSCKVYRSFSGKGMHEPENCFVGSEFRPVTPDELTLMQM